MAAGDLTLIDTNTQAGADIVGISGDGTYIYAACESSGLRSYSVDGAGNITLIDTDFSGDGGDYEALWTDGNVILVGCRWGLRSYLVDGGGNLTYVMTDLQGGMVPGNQYEGVWSDGQFVYVCSFFKGLRVYSVNVTGILTYHSTTGVVGGGQYWRVWGDGNFIYVTGRASGLVSYKSNGDGTVTYKDIDKQGGGSSPYRGVWGDGNFVYVANVGATNPGLMSHSIDPSGGITYIDSVVATQPQEVWGDGNLLYTAGGDLISWSVNVSGGLTLLDSYTDDTYRSVRGDGNYLYAGTDIPGSVLESFDAESSSSSSSVSSSSSSVSSSSSSSTSSSSVSSSSSSSKSSSSLSSSSSSYSSSSNSSSSSISSSSESAITCDFGIHGLERVDWGESTVPSAAANTEFNKVTSNANWCEMLSYIAEAAFPRGLDTDLIFKQIRIVEEGTESEVQYEAIWKFVPSAGLYYADIVHYMGVQFPYGSTLWDEDTDEIIYPVQIEFIGSKELRIWVVPEDGSVPNDMTLVLAGQGSRWSSSSSSTAGVRITEAGRIRRVEGGYAIGARNWRIIDND